jgi:hypothetical protein
MEKRKRNEYDPPRSAGYLVQVIESCDNCRFGEGDEEGCAVCRLYVVQIEVDLGMVIFVPVSPLGKCKHYMKEKEHYDLGGAVTISQYDIMHEIRVKRGEEEEDEDDEE